MTFSKHGSILIGPGGRLPDIPENRELFSRLQEAPELTSEELLRLAEFTRHIQRTHHQGTISHSWR